MCVGQRREPKMRSAQAERRVRRENKKQNMWPGVSQPERHRDHDNYTMLLNIILLDFFFNEQE